MAKWAFRDDTCKGSIVTYFIFDTPYCRAIGQNMWRRIYKRQVDACDTCFESGQSTVDPLLELRAQLCSEMKTGDKGRWCPLPLYKLSLNVL